MKFISVSLIKDEADVIELFIRINSRVIDEFFIVDNGSSDNTVKILEKLAAEGFKITLFRDPNPEYNQSLMTTKALRTASSRTQFDWAFMLDADEFLNIKKQDLEKELANIPGNQIASLKWSTWIPKGDTWYDHNNPLWVGFNRKLKENVVSEKVIISYRLAPVTIVSTGSHEAYMTFNESLNLRDGADLIHRTVLTCGVLDHVPVRSSIQFLSKALLTSLKWSLTPNRNPYDGYHIDNAAILIRRYKYKIDDLLLRYLALNYLAKPDIVIKDEVDENTRFGLETDIMKYKKLAKINERSRFFNFMVSFTDRFRN